MNDDSRRQEQIFRAALRLATPKERAAYLQGACGENEPLRQRVEALLAAQREAGEFGPEPLDIVASHTTVVTTGSATVTEIPVDSIGRYKLLQQIGEGGCGVVYMAEQEEPVRRRVALKVVKLGRKGSERGQFLLERGQFLLMARKGSVLVNGYFVETYSDDTARGSNGSGCHERANRNPSPPSLTSPLSAAPLEVPGCLTHRS